MRRSLLVVTLVVLAAALTPAAGAIFHDAEDGDEVMGRSIGYAGVIHDQRDLARLNLGTAGFWFPQFDAPEPVDHRPTRERAVDALPGWVAPLNHYAVDPLTDAVLDQGCTPEEVVAGCVPTFFFRTFSQDGPAHSKGGQPGWSMLTLPDGTTGRSGAIVDPHAAENTNNTVNRIQLQGDVPAVFYVHVLTDNTAHEHDPVRRVRARGNIGGLDLDIQVEADRFPEACELAFNGTPDLYTFRFEGFQAGDYIKLSLRGDPGGTGASFGGVLFDERFEPAGPHRRAPQGGFRPTC